jgi:hypothetical protein
MEIKGTEYEVHFGIKFIRELDKKYEIERENMKFGAGLEMIVPLLLGYDATKLSEVLYLSTCTEKKRPNQESVDEYVENHEDIEKLFEEVMDELKNSNATRLKVKDLMEGLEELENGKTVA